MILVGYIPTPEGRAALENSIEIARKEALPLVIVNGGRDAPRHDSKRVDDAGIAALEAELTDAGLDFEVVTPRGEDEAAEQLLAVAREKDVTLIVIGVRRRTPVGKFFLGSASQRILLEANVPVLCVKPTP